MKNELILRKCKICGAIVKIIKDCEKEDIECCGEKMEKVIPNSVDAAIEKHVPIYEIKDGKIEVTVNHVMEEEHFIEWIAQVSEGKECIKYLKPGIDAKVQFKYEPGSVIYAYCNKHWLWKKEVQ